MHLSNYNLFSFLVPEGEVLGNQTYSSHWNLVSSVFAPVPFCVPKGIETVDGQYTNNFEENVGVPYLLPEKRFTAFVWTHFFPIENAEVQPAT